MVTTSVQYHVFWMTCLLVEVSSGGVGGWGWMDGWMDSPSVQGATPWDTGIKALTAYSPCQQALTEMRPDTLGIYSDQDPSWAPRRGQRKRGGTEKGQGGAVMWVGVVHREEWHPTAQDCSILPLWRLPPCQHWQAHSFPASEIRRVLQGAPTRDWGRC